MIWPGLQNPIPTRTPVSSSQFYFSENQVLEKECLRECMCDMTKDQGAGDWEGCNKFGKASEGQTGRTMNIMDSGLYSLCQMGPVNGFQEDCDTVTSVL